MGSATERPVLLCRSIGLHQERFLGDRVNIGPFAGRIPVSFALGHSEPSGQGHYWKPPARSRGLGGHPSLAMNLIAVMLGRKQYAAARVVTKLEKPVTLIEGPLL